MENQHRKITGFAELELAQIEQINYFKRVQNELNLELEEIKDPDNARHVALARTYLEIGFMFAVKAVAKPEQ